MKFSVMGKKTKVIICFYIFLAIVLTTSFIYIDSTFVCEDFYTIENCQRPGGPDPNKTGLIFEPEAGKDWVRPTLQFANPKLNEVEIEAEYNVGKEVLFNVISDVENYPIILPKNILSAVIVEQKPNVILAEETMIEQGIRVKLLAKHTIIPYESHTVEIMSGDAEGTKIIQTFIGNESSTKLSTKIQLQLKGLLSPLYFFPKSNFSHAMNTVNSTFADYSKGFDSEYKKIVDDMYREILLRPADIEALEYWSPLLESGMITKDELKNQLLDTDEGLRGELSVLSHDEIIAMMSDEDIQSIDYMYREILLRPADIEDIAHWGGLLEFGLIDKEEVRKQIYNSSEATQKRIDIDISDELGISNTELQIYKNFEYIVNSAYYEIFDKWPDPTVKLHYTELLFFRVMGTMDLHGEFSAGEQTCIYDDTVKVSWRHPNDSEICTFFHPEPTIMPSDWDKDKALAYWKYQPP